MNDIEKEADKMATREYLARGRYGGEAKVNGGAVTGIKYFDFNALKLFFVDKLNKSGFKIIKK